MTPFAQNLRHQRLKVGLSQFELYLKCGISPKQLSNFECGERLPNIQNLIRIKRALGCSYGDLLTDNKQNHD